MVAAGIYLSYQQGIGVCPLAQILSLQKREIIPRKDLGKNEALGLLKARYDKEALAIFENILLNEPDNLEALWGKAEVLRRVYKFEASEELLKRILFQYPHHASSLITLSYIRYHDNQFQEALKILKQVLRQKNLGRENKALVYMLMGSINAKKSSLGGIFSKLAYGTQIKGYFEKAKVLAPDLSEVHLGLGTFYLRAPAIAGGDIDKAIEELKLAVKLTPEFATPQARLAQAYKKKGDLEKYNFYYQQAKTLDPENEVLKEIK